MMALTATTHRQKGYINREALTIVPRLTLITSV